jgi:FHA domain/zinc-ribbon domain
MFCVECGFQNGETANFCAKCGALLAKEDPAGQTTMSFAVQDGLAGDDDVAAERPVLVIRAGGGRAGEHLSLRNPHESIGRAPDADLFLDDVTVSRRHAVIEREEDGLYIKDLESLNGTFVNRTRIADRQRLHDGDEVQIGKFKLTFLER